MTVRVVIAVVTLVMILVLSNYMEINMVEASMKHTEEIKQWRPDWFVKIMHFCSYTGDVDPWWMIAFAYWGFS
jgi:hypothetical protein